MFDVSNFTDIAIKITPKNFRKIYAPLSPNIFFTKLKYLNTKYTINILSITATIILST